MSVKPGFCKRLYICWLIITQKYEPCVEKCEVCGGYHIRVTDLWKKKNEYYSAYYECMDCGSVAVVSERWREKVD